MKEKVLFIINPISGPGNKEYMNKLIDTHIDQVKYDYETIFTEYAGHGKELAQKAVSASNTDIIVAVGGDGTINEIVGALINKEVKLAIIPLGSGNGLGRHLGIPLQPKKAISILNNGMADVIDTCEINGHSFVNVAGVGFDAYISKVFNEGSTRGYLSYLKCIIREFKNYKIREYQCEFDDKDFKTASLTIAMANSQQYGNNAYVAPSASIKDGWIDVVFIRKFHWLFWPDIVLKTLLKKLHTSRFITTYRTKSIRVKSETQFHVHIDGEFFGTANQVHVNIIPKSLNIIVGKTGI